MKIEELSIKEKIGQMVMIGLDTNYITDRIKNMIQNYKIGGVILYRKNFSTYQDMLKLIKELKELNKDNKIPLFIAIDQEGGRVNRMPKEIKNLPSANLIATVGGKELVSESANVIGELLYKSGFNLNFAPVLDIKRFNDKTAIGDRSYGTDKDIVTACGINPIEQAIKNGADAVLVGHLLITNVTGVFPASLSRRFITKYLRVKYRYKGLIITDDLKMRAIKFMYGPSLAVRKAFEAGNDIIVFRFNKDEEKSVLDKIINLTTVGKIKESRINRSVKRIIQIKQKYGISDTKEFAGVDINKINEKIEEIREKCGI